MNKKELGGSCGMYGTGAYRILAGKPEEERPLGCLRHRWKININTQLKDGEGVWLDLAQDREKLQSVVNTVMKLQVP